MVPSFSWRAVFPRSVGDRFSVILSTCEIFAEGLEIWVVLLLEFPEATVSYWLSVILGLFLFVNTLGNYIMTMGIENSTRHVVLPSVLKPGWSYCHQCQQNSPPRCYHCNQCRKCVLKRDHHCIFMGCCIGHGNQRYYLMCIMYISLLTVYANCLTMGIAIKSIGENFNVMTFIASFTPMLGWVYALTQPVSFFIAFQSSTCLYCFFIFTVLFAYHARIVLRGQTTHEFRRLNERLYDLGWMQNIREVLGCRWYLVWIFPLIKSPLPGDGIHFIKPGLSLLEDVKDV